MVHFVAFLLRIRVSFLLLCSLRRRFLSQASPLPPSSSFESNESFFPFKGGKINKGREEGRRGETEEETFFFSSSSSSSLSFFKKWGQPTKKEREPRRVRPLCIAFLYTHHSFLLLYDFSFCLLVLCRVILLFRNLVVSFDRKSTADAVKVAMIPKPHLLRSVCMKNIQENFTPGVCVCGRVISAREEWGKFPYPFRENLVVSPLPPQTKKEQSAGMWCWGALFPFTVFSLPLSSPTSLLFERNGSLSPKIFPLLPPSSPALKKPKPGGGGGEKKETQAHTEGGGDIHSLPFKGEGEERSLFFLLSIPLAFQAETSVQTAKIYKGVFSAKPCPPPSLFSSTTRYVNIRAAARGKLSKKEGGGNLFCLIAD